MEMSVSRVRQVLQKTVSWCVHTLWPNTHNCIYSAHYYYLLIMQVAQQTCKFPSMPVEVTEVNVKIPLINYNLSQFEIP